MLWVIWLPVVQPTTNCILLSQYVVNIAKLVSAHTTQGNACVNEKVAEPTISDDCAISILRFPVGRQ